MFRRLGAGATLAALVDAVDRHAPTARTEAKVLCREVGVRWRDALWPAGIAFAVAPTTQACERDRHRTPYYLVHSLSDGLGQIMKPFAVTGDASNVESGLAELLRYQLLPMLLGHSLEGLRLEYAAPHACELGRCFAVLLPPPGFTAH
jgi:hypothetical protein